MQTIARISLGLIVAALPLAGAEAQPYPQQPYGYGYGYNRPDYGNWIGRLVGSDYDNARYQLSRSGFRQIDSFNAGRRREGSIWFGDRSGQCVQIIASRKRVESAQQIGPQQCGGYQNFPIGGGGAPLLNDLMGKGFNRAQERLAKNGFRSVDSFTNGPNSYATIWFNGSQCLQTTTVNGVLGGVTDIGRHPRCR